MIGKNMSYEIEFTEKSEVMEFNWWNIHKGFDEDDIERFVYEYYGIVSDEDENGETIFDENGMGSNDGEDEHDTPYNTKLTMEMVMNVETFFQKYIDDYDGEFGIRDMGRGLKEWIVFQVLHIERVPKWNYPNRNYKLWNDGTNDGIFGED
jgi:hypothetical protein